MKNSNWLACSPRPPPLSKALNFNMLIPTENVNTDLPLLGIFDLPLYRFCIAFLLGSKYECENPSASLASTPTPTKHNPPKQLNQPQNNPPNKNPHEIHQLQNSPRNRKRRQKLRNPKPPNNIKENSTMTTIMTNEEKELLTRAANLMEELLETIEVSQDKKLVKDLKTALQEVEEEKTRPIEELIRELNLEKDVRN